MTSDSREKSGTQAVEIALAAPDVSASEAGVGQPSGTARLAGLRRWAAPSLPLLPILAAYVLITLAVSATGSDEGSYLGYARNLTHGSYAASHLGYLWHGPGLPGLLAPLVLLHVPLDVMRILVGPVLLFATMVVFHELARLYVGNRAAVITTYCLAAYLPFFSVVGSIHVEPLATLCFTLAVFFMVRSYRGGRRDHLWAGAALAVLALSRVEFGYVLLVALLLSGVWLFVSRRSLSARHSALAMAVALLLCAPWLVYTYSLTGKPFYWGNSGGLSLYWMTAPGNLGDWHGGAKVFTSSQFTAARPVFAQLSHLKPVAEDSKLQHIAFQNIKHDPKHYLSNVVNNIDRLLFNSPYSFTYEKASSMLYAVPNAILLGLLALATFAAVTRRRLLGTEIVAVAAFTAISFAVHVPVAAYARFVIPLVPALAWLTIATLSPYARVEALSPYREMV